MSSQIKKESYNYLLIAFGAILFCAGLNLFIVPVGLYNGGTVGIAQIIRTLLENYTGFRPNFDIAGILNFLINIPLLLLAYKKFGKALFFKTVFSVIIQTIFFSIILIPSTPIISEKLAACVIGGLIAGAGVGITLKAGGTGGGNDILGLYMTKKIDGFSVGKLTLIVNTLIYITCAILFELPTAIYSVIYSFIYSLMVDRVHLQNINMNIQIITKNLDVIQVITNELNRGATYWKGIGAYTSEETYIIITVISKYEIEQLKEILSKIDPSAFIIMSERPEIVGNFEKRL